MTVPEMNCRLFVDHPVVLAGGGHDPVELDLRLGRPAYVTTDGVEVWIERGKLRGGQKTRFLDAEGNQVGPVHTNFYPAIVWAAAQGWRDPSSPDWFNDACIAEVRENSRPLKGRAAEIRDLRQSGGWVPPEPPVTDVDTRGRT